MAVVAVLNVHPSRVKDLLEPDEVQILPEVEVEGFTDLLAIDAFDSWRLQGTVRLSNSTLIEDSGDPDPIPVDARKFPSNGCRRTWFSSCSQAATAKSISSRASPGSFSETRRRDGLACRRSSIGCIPQVTFGYHFARSTKTALDVSVEKQGVCRDFQHLAITLCRAMHIPARYATGYLGDIRIPPVPCPMDFSAWFEVYLGGRWWTCDARHNTPRIGRVLMATGRDAADVAITTTFGLSWLRSFEVVSYEVEDEDRQRRKRAKRLSGGSASRRDADARVILPLRKP